MQGREVRARSWRVPVGAALGGLAAVAEGTLFNWPRSVFGHRFSESEIGSLSEWFGGTAAAVAVLAAAAQLAAGQPPESFTRTVMEDEASRHRQMQEAEHQRGLSERKVSAFEEVERVVTLSAEFMAASADWLYALVMPAGDAGTPKTRLDRPRATRPTRPE